MMEISKLTEQQCEAIARKLYPGMDWRYHVNTAPETIWAGHDLVAGINHNDGSFLHVLQISFEGEIVFWDELQDIPAGGSQYAMFYELLQEYESE